MEKLVTFPKKIAKLVEFKLEKKIAKNIASFFVQIYFLSDKLKNHRQ
jgi:hypothetical protein